MSRPLINTDKLRRARAALGLSQAALARRVGVSQGLIWAIENGRKTPSLDVFVRLCAALSLPLEALVKAEGSEAPDELEAGLRGKEG